jgi:hypothetical protein
MTDREHRDLELDREDARFVARLREMYAPEPLDAARRAAFDARLRERTLRARRFRLALAPALAAAAIAAWAVWSAGPRTKSGEVPPPPEVAETPVEFEWEQDVFYGDLAPETAELGEELPPEYAAIDLVFLEGG